MYSIFFSALGLLALMSTAQAEQNWLMKTPPHVIPITSDGEDHYGLPYALSEPSVAQEPAVVPGAVTPDSFKACRKGVDDYLEPYFEALKHKDTAWEYVCTLNPKWPLTDQEIDMAGKLLGSLNLKNLSPACILKSMQAMGDPVPGNKLSHKFGACAADMKVTAQKSACKKDCALGRPCVSPNYHAYVYNSFTEAANCVGVNPLELFPLINNESSFHVNVGSFSGAWGPGQFTGPGIKEVNNELTQANLLEKLKAKPECEKIKGAIEQALPMPTEETARLGLAAPERQQAICETITPPSSGVKSFVYASILYNKNRRIAAALIDGWDNPNIASDDKERAIAELSTYMYNAGEEKIGKMFKKYIAWYGKKANFKKFQSQFKSFLAAQFDGDAKAEKSEKILLLSELEQTADADQLDAKRKRIIEIDRNEQRREEVSTYSSAIRAKAIRLEKKVGAKCSIEG